METLVCLDDFEREALEILGKNAREYFTSGADDGITVKENSQAFSRWIIRTRVLRDVSDRQLSTSILGKLCGVPIGVSPSAFQRLAHEDGEIATAKAAEAIGGIHILSVYATRSYEEIAAAAPNVRRWAQFYLHKDRSTTKKLIERAERAGYEALVLTVDAQDVGNRRCSKRDGLHLPPHITLPNAQDFDSLVVGTNDIFAMHDLLERNITWEAVKWLKSVTKLPLVIKGIQAPEDAGIAVEYGTDAVLLSNHGGRQIDTAIPTIDMLPHIVKAVRGRCEVYMDGGVRRGSDIFKALALGANMVFVGRPAVFGAAVGGVLGATKVLQILKEELDMTMALSGIRNIKELNGNSTILTHQHNNSKY